jgi:hypothetical protein
VIISGGYVELGNEATSVSNMTFACKVYSTANFPGTGNWTQLINRNANGTPAKSTGNQDWLDNGQFYNTGANIGSGQSFPPTTINSVGSVPFADAPGVPVNNYVTISDAFQTYLVFQPSGDTNNIWVALGVVTWGWAATEGSGIFSYTLINPSVTQATYTPGGGIVVWSNTLHTY